MISGFSEHLSHEVEGDSTSCLNSHISKSLQPMKITHITVSDLTLLHEINKQKA